MESAEDALSYVTDQDAGTEIDSGRGKKQKQGLEGRKEILDIRSQMPTVSSSDEHAITVDTGGPGMPLAVDGTVRGQKRKIAQNDTFNLKYLLFAIDLSQLIISNREVQATAKNKKPRGPPVPSGMLDKWDSQDFFLLPKAQEHNARSQSTTSVGSWRSSDVDTMDITTDHASESVIGGFPSDDEVEHKEIGTRVTNKSGASGIHFRVCAIFS